MGSGYGFNVAEKPKALPGEVPERPQHEEPKLREHDWDELKNGGSDRYGAANWLNNENGKVAKTCRRCGAELLADGFSVRAGEKLVSGKEFVYRDRKGHEIRSFVELSCPLMVAGGGGAAAVAMEHARIGKVEAKRAAIQAADAEWRITQLEQENRALNASFEARIIQLEQENKALRAEVDSVKQIDLTQLAKVLIELAGEAKERKALQPVRTEARVYQVPKELVEVIDVVGIPVGETLPDQDGDTPQSSKEANPSPPESEETPASESQDSPAEEEAASTTPQAEEEPPPVPPETPS